jgi:potassium-transporting ATPase potassium-binding subunit
MTGSDWIQISLYMAVLLVLVKPLGSYMAWVYGGRWESAPERWIYRLAGIARPASMHWKAYAGSLLASNAVGFLLVYLLLRAQQWLPWNPQAMGPVAPHTAFNIAVSFATNTNWQNYGGEATLSYFTQMAGLTVQNFVSAASGMAVLVALARGLAGRGVREIGNFWADLVRGTLYILLPLSALLCLALVSQGVIQNLDAYVKVADSEQVLPMGPAASQVAIKQLGTNGGGFFNVNSAHPFENPTPLSNFLECLAILLIPAAMCYTFGCLVKDRRQGWALLAAMLLIFVPLLFVTVHAEQGNLEGKEVRFGATNSALWAVATTAASNGSVNSMHDSYTPIGGLVPMFLMQLGEVVVWRRGFGPVRHDHLRRHRGLPRRPDGGPHAGVSRQEGGEFRDEDGVDRDPCAAVVRARRDRNRRGDADGVERPRQPRPARLQRDTVRVLLDGEQQRQRVRGLWSGQSAGELHRRPRHAAGPLLGGAAGAGDRGLAGAKNTIPAGPGTLPTHTPLFVVLLAGAVLIVGALAFIPALALGPIVEALQ